MGGPSVDFVLAARQGIDAHRSETPREEVVDAVRAGLEVVLREVERQWRSAHGWRGRFYLEEVVESSPPRGVVAWFRCSYGKRWWQEPSYVAP